MQALELLQSSGLDSIDSLKAARVDCADLDRLRVLFEDECDCPDCHQVVAPALVD